MQGVSLRLARPADAAAMTVMQRASWLAAYGEVLGADMLARTLLAPAELPVGIITALMGAPFFIWLLVKSRRTL